MKVFRGALVLLLSWTLGVQPALAQMSSVEGASSARPGPVSAVGGVAPLRLENFPLPPSALSPAANAALPFAPITPAAPSAIEAAPEANPAGRLAQTRAAADGSVVGLERAPDGAARGMGEAQFAALVHERLISADARSVEASAPQASGNDGPHGPLGRASASFENGNKAGPPAPKLGLTQVFRDQDRNKAYWLYVAGSALFLIGYEMYVVVLPSLISSITGNALNARRDPRAGDKDVFEKLVAANRLLARNGHWIGQAASYVAIPLFTRDAAQGPRKWLVRAMLIRAGLLALVPVLFFSAGAIGMTAAVWTFVVLAGAQSFFQGVSITAEGTAVNRMLGSDSVAQDERLKANKILTVLGSVFSIIGPLLAGRISMMKPVLNKTGVGGAAIYLIYAVVVALAAFTFSRIRLFAGASTIRPSAAPAGAPKTFLGVAAELWLSIKGGVVLICKDRLLLTMSSLAMASAFFSDTFVFGVLPDFVDGLATRDAASLAAMGGVPVVGWMLKTLTTSQMGSFALMMVAASVGGIVSTLLTTPAMNLFRRLGFKTDKALAVPFYWIAALEAPLFYGMLPHGSYAPSLLGVAGLYGLQAVVAGFIVILVQALYQKKMGGFSEGDVYKQQSASSLGGILVTIIGLGAYFLFKKFFPHLDLSASLTIAASAMGVIGLLRLFAPFWMFSRDERRGTPPPPPGTVKLRAEPTGRSAHKLPTAGGHHHVPHPSRTAHS